MRSRLTDGHEDIIYSDYLQSFQSITDEIKSLRTKVSIILGFFGVALSILIANIVTKSYSINNLNTLVSQITGSSLVQEDISYQLLITPLQDGVFDGLLLPLLVYLLILIAVDYFMLFINTHYVPNMVFPTKEQLTECDNILSNDLRKKKLCSHLKTAVDNVDCDYKFYLRYLKELNHSALLYVLLCMAALFLYVLLNTADTGLLRGNIDYFIILLCLGIIGGILSLQCSVLNNILEYSNKRARRYLIVEKQDWISRNIRKFSIYTPLSLFLYIGLSFGIVMLLYAFLPFEPPFEFIVFLLVILFVALIIVIQNLYKKFYKPVRDLMMLTRTSKSKSKKD